MIRHALHGLLNTVILLVLLVLVVAILVQTGPGKRFLASQLSSSLSTPEAGIEITGIRGWIPIDMQIDRLQLFDRRGLWLDATGLALDWSPKALFNGRLQIDALEADHIAVARLPDESDEIEEPSDEPFRLPPLPTSLPPLTVAELSVNAIDLDAPVLGEAASFELDGSLTASDDGRQVDLAIDLRRLDQATAYLTLTSTVSLDPAMLAIDLDASENGNLLEELTGRVDAGDLDLVLTGEGPLDNWSGQVSAKADGLGTADANLFLALIDQPELRLQAAVRPKDSVLPADYKALIGEGLDLSLAVTQTRAQAINVERFDIEADQLGMRAKGSVDFDQGDLDVNAALDVPALQIFNDITGVALTGEAGATLTIEGSVQEPRGVVALRGRGLSADGVEVSDLETTMNLVTTAPLGADHAALDLKGTGSARGLAVPDTPLPNDALAWTTDLLLPLDGGAITLRLVTLKTADTLLWTDGSIDPGTLASELDLQLSTETLRRLIAPYSAPDDHLIDGKVSIQASIQTSDQAETLSIDLQAAANELTGFPDGAKELIGDKLDVKAVVRLGDHRDLTLSDLLLDGENATITGNAALDLKSRDLAVEASAILPRLSELASSIQRPLDGALYLDATVGGSLDVPEVTLSATSDELTFAEERIEAVSLILNSRDFKTGPKGNLQLDLTARTVPLSLLLDYQLDEATLALQAIELEGPETTIGGDLTVNLDAMLVDGALKGRLNDLASLHPLHDQTLRGSIDLDARLSAEQIRQDATLLISGRDVSGDFGQAARIDLTAGLQDLLGKTSIKAETNIAEYEQGDVKLATVALRTEGDLERLAIDLSLDGEAVEPLNLETSGTLLVGGPIKLGIDRLTGRFAGEQLSLDSPLMIEQDKEILTLTDLTLRLGSASLEGDIDIGEQDVSGRIDLRSLPLDWLGRFDGPEMDGIASAELDLGGTIDRPTMNALLELRSVQTEELATSDLPSIDVTIRSELDADRLTSNLLASGLTEEPITATASHPMVLRLRPFALEIPEDGDVDGEIRAALSMARVGDLLALDGHVLRGDLTADLELAGTVGSPLVDGPIKLQNGLYENVSSGIEFRDVELSAAASNKRITIGALSAKAGQSGTATGDGWIDLDAGKNFPLSLALSVAQAELINRDDMEATITGDVAMLGDLNDATINGTLTINRAEFSIPEGGGPDVPEIKVEEIGGVIINLEKRDEVETDQSFDPELDIKISAPNKVFVRGRGLDSEWEGDLRITGPTSAPRITGSLEIRKGSFDFIEKRFEIEKGIIDFKGASPPNPILAIEAAATDGDFKAIVKLDGPAEQPSIRLESEPALPEDEVLARLLFNRELSEIGPVEAAKLALALNQLRGGGGFDAFGEIRNALNIDTLDIVSGEEAADSRVKAGKYINDEVYVEVEQGAADGTGRARVEVEILPSISLEADTGTDSTGGVGVKWRFDY